MKPGPSRISSGLAIPATLDLVAGNSACALGLTGGFVGGASGAATDDAALVEPFADGFNTFALVRPGVGWDNRDSTSSSRSAE
jgi:hypothetical protein